MKRKNASLLGNVLMGLGLVVMVVGVGYSALLQIVGGDKLIIPFC